MTDAGATPMKEPSRRTLWADDFQRKHRVVGFPIAVLYKFIDDSGSYLAALITYYAFVSLLPLLLLLTTLLSVVLRHNPGLQQQIVNSALGQIPSVGTQFKDPGRLSGGIGGVLVGLIVATYGGLGIGQAVQFAMNSAWAVPRNERPNPLLGRVRSLMLIGCAALVLLATTAVSWVGDLFHGEASILFQLTIPLLIIVVDVLLFIPIYRHGVSRSLEVRQVLPGVVVAAIGWTLLQTYGIRYVAHVVKHASPVNQAFAVALGLVAFLYLISMVTIFCVEINVVLDKKLYPRALLTPFTDNVSLTGGDRRAYTGLAQAQRNKGFQQIDVSFDQPAPQEPEPRTATELRDARRVAADDGTPVAHGSSLTGEVHPRGDDDEPYDQTVPLPQQPPQD